MPLRVIAGTARGRRLKPVPGASTRPIMDRVKEALFSILGRNILDARFLDLYAGTGSVGIEALSRGAAQVVFVELDREALRTIRTNLEITRLGENAIIRRADVLNMLKGPPPIEPFDFIFLAPPQYKSIWLETLRRLDGNPAWLGEHTAVIVQIDPREFQDETFAHLEIYDERRYGKTLLLFLARKDTPAADADATPAETAAPRAESETDE